MNKVALKKIGFVEQNEENDNWVQQEQQAERSLSQDIYIDGIHRFRSIDQAKSSIMEDLSIEESGNKYHQHVQFVVRTKYDRELAKKYERRPLVVHVWTVDGCHYKLGTKSYPAYFVPSKTNSMDTVETAMTVDYDTLTAIM
jgi:hypothetical protein